MRRQTTQPRRVTRTTVFPHWLWHWTQAHEDLFTLSATDFKTYKLLVLEVLRTEVRA